MCFLRKILGISCVFQKSQVLANHLKRWVSLITAAGLTPRIRTARQTGSSGYSLWRRKKANQELINYLISLTIGETIQKHGLLYCKKKREREYFLGAIKNRIKVMIKFSIQMSHTCKYNHRLLSVLQ